MCSKLELIHTVTSYLIKWLDKLDCGILAAICDIEIEKCDEDLLAKAKQEVRVVLETYLKSLSS